MKKILLSLLLWITGYAGQAQQDELVIRHLLLQQTEAWNRGDLEGFMQGYWKSDSLMFIGKNGVTQGWQATLDNYKRGYPDTVAMGKLAFELVEIKQLATNYTWVTGKWKLFRSIGHLNGMYTLLLQKISGRWVIIRDHSS